MKHLLYFTAVCLSLVTFNSCEKMTDEDKPFTFSIPGGESKTIGSGTDSGSDVLNASFLAPSDIDGFVHTSVFYSKGKMVEDNIYFSMELKEKSLVAGKEPEIERLHFGYFFSSYSGDYTDTFKGTIRVKKYNDQELVLRFNRVTFTVAMGTCRLNGDLVFTRRDPISSNF